MSNKILTAEDFFFQNIQRGVNDTHSNYLKIAKEFAKAHVKAALEKAAEDANLIGETQHNNGAPDIIRDFAYESNSNGPDYGFTVNKDSILNAYPEDLIN